MTEVELLKKLLDVHRQLLEAQQMELSILVNLVWMLRVLLVVLMASGVAVLVRWGAKA